MRVTLNAWEETSLEQRATLQVEPGWLARLFGAPAAALVLVMRKRRRSDDDWGEWRLRSGRKASDSLVFALDFLPITDLPVARALPPSTKDSP